MPLRRPEEQHVGQRQRFAVRDGEERSGRVHRVGSVCRAAVKPQLRGTSGADDLDIAPDHALRMSRTEGLHGRFLGREACGKVGCRVPAPCGVGDLARRKHAFEETIAKPCNREFNAVDLRRVEPETDNVHTGL